MPKRKAEAIWTGNLKQGNGTMKLGSGAFEGAFSFGTRFEEVPGTNPEELIGAALAGCYSMALSADLEQQGYAPVSVETQSTTVLEFTDSGPEITEIILETKARVPNIESARFQEIANATKGACPVSKALKAVKISLDATLIP